MQRIFAKKRGCSGYNAAELAAGFDEKTQVAHHLNPSETTFYLQNFQSNF